MADRQFCVRRAGNRLIVGGAITFLVLVSDGGIASDFQGCVFPRIPCLGAVFTHQVRIQHPGIKVNLTNRADAAADTFVRVESGLR
jgi:hypothetical protein